LSSYNLINFGFNPWSNFWKRNQTIFYLLSRENFVDKALFINSEVWPIDLIKNPKKELNQPRISNWKYIVPKRIDFKISIYSPIVLPFSSRYNIMNDITIALSKSICRGFIEKPVILLVNYPLLGMQRHVLKFFSNAHLKIFDWSDDFEHFSQDFQQQEVVSKTIKYYLTHADIVFTINERLTDRAKIYNPASYTVPNATNMFTFPTREDLYPIPKKLRDLKPPIIGYMGWLNDLRLDLELIEYLVKERPSWNFVFIGPESHELPLGANIIRYPNILIHEPVHYQNLSSILNQWDACILPNQINAHTMGNDPIKIYDYLATGKPTVSTRTAGTERVADYLYLSDTKEQFLKQLDRIIAGNDFISREKRLNIAYDNSWKNRFSDILSMLSPYLKV